MVPVLVVMAVGRFLRTVPVGASASSSSFRRIGSNRRGWPVDSVGELPADSLSGPDFAGSLPDDMANEVPPSTVRIAVGEVTKCGRKWTRKPLSDDGIFYIAVAARDLGVRSWSGVTDSVAV